MKLSILTNDVLTKGAILGGVMLASNIAECSMLYWGNSFKWQVIISLESLVAMAMFCYLLYRFTSNYATLVLSERKELPYFTFGNGLSYAVRISMLAGVVVSVGNYIFTHYIIGYDKYIARQVEVLRGLAQMTIGEISQWYYDMANELENADIPSLGSTVISSVWVYLLAGTIVGLVVAAITKRAPQMFNK